LKRLHKFYVIVNLPLAQSKNVCRKKGVVPRVLNPGPRWRCSASRTLRSVPVERAPCNHRTGKWMASTDSLDISTINWLLGRTDRNVVTILPTLHWLHIFCSRQSHDKYRFQGIMRHTKLKSYLQYVESLMSVSYRIKYTDTDHFSIIMAASRRRVQDTTVANVQSRHNPAISVTPSRFKSSEIWPSVLWLSTSRRFTDPCTRCYIDLNRQQYRCENL
jgi:AraC-like DNA-binding protein